MDTKNIIAAISLSAAVIILYSLFFAPSPQERKQIYSEKNKTSQNASGDAPGGDDMDMPEPEMDLGGEEEEEELMEVEVDEQKLQEVINNVTDRVTKRILKEAIARRISKK